MAGNGLIEDDNVISKDTIAFETRLPPAKAGCALYNEVMRKGKYSS
jgi:hypothetical protein